MKRIIAILILIEISCVGYADNKPKWIKKLPRIGNPTYRYVMESASAANVSDARNQAFLRVFYSTATRLGMPFSSEEVQNAVNTESDFEVISTQYNVPINKVCEYRKKISGGVEVYLLCQVAERGNIEVVFDEFRDCEAHLSDEIAIEVDFPTDWNLYKTSAYISSFQRDKNYQSISETSFKTHLMDVAKQEVVSRMGISGNEKALVNTLSFYNQNTHDGFAVAYVEKASACSFYKKDIDMLINKVENGIERANTLSASDNNDRAKQELQSLLPLFSDIDKQLSKLTTYGCSTPLNNYTLKRNTLEQTVKTNLNTIETSVISIYIDVDADLFGSAYTQLKSALFQRLSSQDYVLADSLVDATYEISIAAKSLKHPAPINTTYFAYVEATITIKNLKTKKIVYNGDVSEKGGSTLNYENAARNAYKNIDNQLASIISSQVKK